MSIIDKIQPRDPRTCTRRNIEELKICGLSNFHPCAILGTRKTTCWRKISIIKHRKHDFGGATYFWMCYDPRNPGMRPPNCKKQTKNKICLKMFDSEKVEVCVFRQKIMFGYIIIIRYLGKSHNIIFSLNGVYAPHVTK